MEKGLLYFMHGNIQMGMLSTRHLIEISPDEKLRRALLEDLHAYEKFQNAVFALQGENQQLKTLTNMAQRGTEMAIDMKTAFSKETDKLEDMLVKGYEKAISALHENLQNAENEKEDVKQLATGYMNFLRQCHARYKGF